MEKLFDKLGKFIISFFLLQIHFGIKGSNAVPGNSQPNAKKPASPPASPKSLKIQNDWLESNEPQQPQQQHILLREDSQMILNSQNSIYSNEDNKESIEIKQLELELDNVILKGGLLLLNDIKPALSNDFVNESFDEDCFHNSPDSSSDRLNYSMLQSNFPHLRPKTISRQSLSSSGGGDILDSEWIEIDSGFSGSSRIAKMIFSMRLVNDQELQPITYDQLCKFLDELSDKEMCEQELLIICKRITKGSETLMKALKDLPLYIQTTRFNQNAIKINSILFSYLSNSDKCYLDLLNNEQNENGSGSSRCSSRGSDSSISSKNSLTSMIQSFSDLKIGSDNSCEHNEKECEGEIEGIKIEDDDKEEEEEEEIHLCVFDEIHDAQSHVPHEPLQQIFSIPANSYFPRTTFNRMTMMSPSYHDHHHFYFRHLLTTVREEKTSKSNGNDTEIEEID